jgi:hypothetical protein
MENPPSSHSSESEDDAPPQDAPVEPSTRTTRSKTLAPAAPVKSPRKKAGPGRNSVPDKSKTTTPKKRKRSEIEDAEPQDAQDGMSEEEEGFMKLRRAGRGEAKGKERAKLVGSVPALDHQRLGSATKAMSSIVCLQFSLQLVHFRF